MAKTVVAFDLYGTLLSTGSIAKELTRLYGAENAKTVATQARRYQLEYTWRANSMGEYNLKVNDALPNFKLILGAHRRVPQL